MFFPKATDVARVGKGERGGNLEGGKEKEEGGRKEKPKVLSLSKGEEENIVRELGRGGLRARSRK